MTPDTQKGDKQIQFTIDAYWADSASEGLENDNDIDSIQTNSNYLDGYKIDSYQGLTVTAKVPTEEFSAVS